MRSTTQMIASALVAEGVCGSAKEAGRLALRIWEHLAEDEASFRAENARKAHRLAASLLRAVARQNAGLARWESQRTE